MTPTFVQTLIFPYSIVAFQCRFFYQVIWLYKEKNEREVIDAFPNNIDVKNSLDEIRTQFTDWIFPLITINPHSVLLISETVMLSDFLNICPINAMNKIFLKNGCKILIIIGNKISFIFMIFSLTKKDPHSAYKWIWCFLNILRHDPEFNSSWFLSNRIVRPMRWNPFYLHGKLMA